MANKLTPLVRPFLDSNGDPYSGALLFAYTAGSATKVTVYQDEAGNTAHTNPAVLNARGEVANGSGTTKLMWQPEGTTLDFVLAPSTDTDPPVSAIDTYEDISGINDTTVTIDQWIAGNAPTYVNATSFTLVGDQTTNFHVGRRIKTTNTSGTVYSTISVSAYTSLTTITVVNDSGSLDSGLSAVSYGILTADNDSIPDIIKKVHTGTAGGTVDVITSAVYPAIKNLADKDIVYLKAAGANATTTPTFNPNSLGAETIVKNGNEALDIGDIPRADYEIILIRNSANTTWELLNPAGESEIQSITGAVASSALTLGLKADILDFRSATATNGITNSRAFSDLSLVVPSGATLGTVDAVESDLILFAIDNAGTIELAVGNRGGGHDLSEESLISTTAIGTGSDSDSVIYSTSARTAVPFRVVGQATSTQATAGTWAAAPSNLQGAGGRSISGGAADGSSMVLLSTQTASASTSVDFTSNIDGTYDSYKIIVTSLVNASNANLFMRVSQSAAFKTDTNYYYSNVTVDQAGTVAGDGSAAANNGNIGLSLGVSAGDSYNGEFSFSNPDSTSLYARFFGDSCYQTAAGGNTRLTSSFYYRDTGAIDGVQFKMASGNITSGVFRLYGIKDS